MSARTRRPYSSQYRKYRSKSAAGVTLIELLVVIMMVGILAAIAAPSWLGMRNSTSLTAAQDEIFQAIRQAQLQAVSSRQTRQAQFRTVGNHIEWAIVNTSVNTSATADTWTSLKPNVQIATSETTLSRTADTYFIEFNHKGYVVPPFGRISLAYRQGQERRCIFISSLLGVLRRSSGYDCYR